MSKCSLEIYTLINVCKKEIDSTPLEGNNYFINESLKSWIKILRTLFIKTKKSERSHISYERVKFCEDTLIKS